jgi:hypothetical protein
MKIRYIAEFLVSILKNVLGAKSDTLGGKKQDADDEN